LYKLQYIVHSILTKYYIWCFMNKNNIEHSARQLQIKIWKQRKNLWPNGHPHLARMFEVAGFINRLHKTIEISKRFPRETMRFTGAHEIGHWLMHPKENMHRDRPINGLTSNTYKKPFMEAEADYFAACFLMPKITVKNCFEEKFNITAPLEINDTTAFKDVNLTV